MHLPNILISLFVFLVIGTLLLWSIKTSNLFPLDSEKFVLLDPFKITIPTCWLKVETNHTNELNFARADSTDNWKAFIRTKIESTETSLIEVLNKYISERMIQFDESDLINLNPELFNDSPIIKSKHFEMARIEGDATINKEDRNYCDVVIFRNLTTGLSLYAESRGPILNGFFEARYFEDVILRLDFEENNFT